MSRDVTASIRARLLNRAKRGGIEYQLYLVRHACERFLYRPGQSAVRDRLILKGGTLISLCMPEPFRSTRDIDIETFRSPSVSEWLKWRDGLPLSQSV